MATRPIEELDPQGEVEDWLDRFEQMVEVNAVYLASTTDDERATRKRALLLSLIGGEGYRLLKAYLAPEAPNTKTYNELKTCIKNNLAPTPSAISEAYKLSQLKQETSESMALFMSRIKISASKCDFGNSYDRMVRDKFICGIRSEKLRANLINDTNVTTSAQALERAIARENSETAAHNMNVNAVKYGKSNLNHNRKPWVQSKTQSKPATQCAQEPYLGR